MRSNKRSSIVSGGLRRNPYFGETEQQSIVDYSTSKLVPHPQLLFALGLPTILNWLPSNSVVKSIVLPLSSSNEAKSITTSAFPVPTSSSAANMVSSSGSTLEGPSSDIRYWKPWQPPEVTVTRRRLGCGDLKGTEESTGGEDVSVICCSLCSGNDISKVVHCHAKRYITPIVDGRCKKCKTINSRYSLVVTHPTTNLPARGLSTAERTGSPGFHVLWSIAKSVDKKANICKQSQVIAYRIAAIASQLAHTHDGGRLFNTMHHAYGNSENNSTLPLQLLEIFQLSYAFHHHQLEGSV
jgi:hypothetical protein